MSDNLYEVGLPHVMDPTERGDIARKVLAVARSMADTPYVHLPPINERNEDVEHLLTFYVTATGETPDPTILNLLSNYILAGKLLDPTSHKASYEEYPIINGHQRNRAEHREYAMGADVIDFLHSKYTLRLDTLYRVTRIEKRV